MAKISPASIKYTISADFRAEGPLEKPDVIGALFGQTEGLLGADMEFRELQKEGKIGRIDVELTTEGGKTTGEIHIPSALDKAETAILAAAIETIDKIGPTDAKITIKQIEDVRGSKRDYIMERAKKLLGSIQGAGLESDEMHKELSESNRISKLTEYGEERLPAGDLSGNEVIVCEGRADVVNLLKHGIKNAIGMNGTRLPAAIAKLGEEKELTLFVDGDRGGRLIAKNVYDNAKIAFIASAPDGKEVEELTGKEILQALRKKVPAREIFGSERKFSRYEEPVQESKVSEKVLSKEDKEKLRNLAGKLSGRDVIVLDENLDIMGTSSVSKAGFLRVRGAFILLTEEANTSVIVAAEKLNAKYVAAKIFNRVPETNVNLISL
jgi:DNA primase